MTQFASAIGELRALCALLGFVIIYMTMKDISIAAAKKKKQQHVKVYSSIATLIEHRGVVEPNICSKK